jgi:hypothetical protein
MAPAHLDSNLVERVFHSLPAVDQMEVMTFGASFHRLKLEKKLERARSKIQALEARYGVTLDRLELQGLPDDADYAVHEDYVGWRYWQRVERETQNAVDARSVFALTVEPS